MGYVMRRKAAVIWPELEALRTELLALDAKADTDTTKADIARSDAASAELTTLTTEYDEAVRYEASIEAVRSLAAKHVEPVTEVTRRGPEVMTRVDPWDSASIEAARKGWAEPGDMISRAQSAVEHAPRHVNDAARARLTELLEDDDNSQTAGIARHMLLTGSPQYHTEFQEFFRTKGAVLGEAMRAAMTLTGANGGYLVPFTLDPTIILTNSGIAGPLRSISRTITIVTNNWNGVTSAGVTAEWTGEATAWADATPTFAQPTITPKKADAWIQGSYEVLADSGFASEIGRLLADAKVRLEETAFAVGNTGATQPRGVVAAVAAVTASIVTSATTGAFVSGDVYSVANALRPRDAANATWIANKAITNKIRSFDTAGGSSFWANFTMASPPMLLGQPVHEASAMTATIGNGTNIALAGNFDQFYIVDRVGMTVMYEPMVKTTASGGRPTGEAGWAAFWRTGSDVVDPAAFRLLQLNQVAANTALA
jgi:HK97 family phage major capsid protein